MNEFLSFLSFCEVTILYYPATAFGQIVLRKVVKSLQIFLSV